MRDGVSRVSSLCGCRRSFLIAHRSRLRFRCSTAGEGRLTNDRPPPLNGEKTHPRTDHAIWREIVVDAIQSRVTRSIQAC